MHVWKKLWKYILSVDLSCHFAHWIIHIIKDDLPIIEAYNHKDVEELERFFFPCFCLCIFVYKLLTVNVFRFISLYRSAAAFDTFGKLRANSEVKFITESNVFLILRVRTGRQLFVNLS